MRENFARTRRELDGFRRLPVDDRRRRLATVRERVLAFRARHIMEYESIQSGDFDREAPQDDWLFTSYFFDRYNYWTFIHTDDSTAAFERAITVDFDGAHALFVNANRNYLNYESEALLSIFFPDVKARTQAIEGAAALVSNDRARDMIGFEPAVNAV